MDGEHILIVEDNAPLRGAIQMLLEQDGYRVLTAANGAEGLEVMDRRVPDLIVADIAMPVMDGYDFFEAVRANAAWQMIPFVFLTAKAAREDVLKGKALGVEDYLVKPLDPDELLVVVRAKLARAQTAQESADQEIQQLKGEIVRALSHELRTPLTWIMAYAELTIDYLRTLPPEELQEFLTHVLAGGERIARLTDDLLTLIRLDDGQLKAEVRQVMSRCEDVGGTVRRVAESYRARADTAGLALEIHTGADLPPVRMHEILFGDALGRLIDNAIKFSGERGKTVRVTADAVGDRVVVAVSDEGIGIAPEAVERLFQRFRQIDRTQQEQQGVGLGLAIARELIVLQGGDIEVESAPGAGSTFRVWLPADPLV